LNTEGSRAPIRVSEGYPFGGRGTTVPGPGGGIYGRRVHGRRGVRISGFL